MSDDTADKTKEEAVADQNADVSPVTDDTQPAVEESATEETIVEDAPVEELSSVEEKTLLSQKAELPEFRPGDTVRILYKIIEGAKERVQPYEGIVISKKGSGISKTFTVRRIGADRIGVERIFPLFSPNIVKLEVKKTGKVRRAKLYYLREKVGRAATRVREQK